MNTKIPVELVDSINNKKLLIFAGAGLSVNSGFPSWSSIVTDLLIENEKYIEKSKPLLEAMNSEIMSPLDVLDKISENKKIIYKVFEEKLNKKHVSDLHKNIGLLTSKIVPTNFDTLIEQNTEISNIITQKSNYNLSKIDNEDEFLLKIHGDISSIDHCVIFSEQYKTLYNTERFSTFQLQKLISTHTILFIGFSFTDPYVTQLFEKIQNLQDNYGPKHYFISNSQTDIRNINDIKIKSLECINIGGYSNLATYIEKLVSIKKVNKINPTEIDCAATLLKDIDGSDIAPIVTGWVGREEELFSLNSDTFKVIFITGIGGGGKSALASYYLQNEKSYPISEWKDFKEQEHKFQHKIISMIKSISPNIKSNDLIDFSDTELINLFFLPNLFISNFFFPRMTSWTPHHNHPIPRFAINSFTSIF